MKVLMMVPVWKRSEIFKIFLDKLKSTMPDFQLIPFFVLSKDDPQYQVNLKLVSGYKYTEFHNEPLGRKKNEGLKIALKLFDFDYYMDMGSDNVWTYALWNFLKPDLDNSTEYFGIKNIHVYEIQQNIAIFLKDFHTDPTKSKDTPTALGPGRCIRRDVVEKCFPLWRDTMHMGMDGVSHFTLVRNGYDCKVIDNGDVPTILDLKTSTNITQFNEVQSQGEQVEPRLIYEWFGLNQFNIYNSDFTTLITFEGFRDRVLKSIELYGSQERAFHMVNFTYQSEFGEPRFSSYGSYRVAQSKKMKR